MREWEYQGLLYKIILRAGGIRLSGRTLACRVQGLRFIPSNVKESTGSPGVGT